MRADLNPYRLLMTCDTVGGVWRYALDAARELSRAGISVTLATLGPVASADQRAEAGATPGLRLVETGEALDWLCDSRADVRRAAYTIAQLAREVEADVVQLNGAALAADAAFPAPVLAVQHSCLATWWASVKGGPLPADWQWRRDLVGEHLRRAAVVAAPTRAFAEATAAAYGLGETPRVIHNARPQPALASSTPAGYVLTAGRLWDEGKNVATLDRAAAKIAAPVFAAGPCVGPQGARVSFANLQPTGVLSEAEMRAKLSERPVFACVPLYEPFGLAALEAAQAGCALILSDIATLRELWDGAATFVAPRDDAALADAANRLLRDGALRRTLGAAARRRAAAYGMERFAAALMSWHRVALSAGREAA